MTIHGCRVENGLRLSLRHIEFSYELRQSLAIRHSVACSHVYSRYSNSGVVIDETMGWAFRHTKRSQYYLSSCDSGICICRVDVLHVTRCVCVRMCRLFVLVHVVFALAATRYMWGDVALNDLNRINTFSEPSAEKFTTWSYRFRHSVM